VITTPSHTGNKKRFILEEKLHIAPYSTTSHETDP